MNIPKSYEALSADLASEKIISKTLQGQKESYMMLADGRKLDLYAIQRRLTVAEQRAEMLEREFKKLRDIAYGCYQIASSYSGCIDGVEEHGGDDHDDPSCAIFHRLYYAMFDADAALKPAAEPRHICKGCGAKGWTANCAQCVPY